MTIASTKPRRTDPGGAVHGTEAEPLVANDLYQWKWYEQSCDRIDDGPLDKGIRTHLVTIGDHDGRRVGYLRISSVPPSWAATFIADPITYQTCVGGWCVGAAATPGVLWAKAHHYAQRSPASAPDLRPGSLTAGDAPEAPAAFEADLDILRDLYRDDARSRVAALETPFVAYSNVNDDHRRQGLATAACVAAAVKLGQRSQILRASSLRSNYAHALWARLIAGDYPTIEVAPPTARTNRPGNISRRLTTYELAGRRCRPASGVHRNSPTVGGAAAPDDGQDRAGEKFGTARHQRGRRDA